MEVKTKRFDQHRFEIGDLVKNSGATIRGVVYDYGVDCSSSRVTFYGVMWSNGKKSWERFHSLVLVQAA